MWDLSREGISSLFVSTELEELIEVSHRILVMKHGQIVHEVQAEEVTHRPPVRHVHGGLRQNE